MGARLGQHFLKNTYYASLLATECHATLGDTIVEIGPGGGVLTNELLLTGAHVIAIEKDEALAAQLGKKYGEGIQLITGDVRDFDPTHYGLQNGRYILAANIPYYITGEIIRQFLTARVQPSRMLLLIQKEVAQRIISEKESLLSLSVKVFGEPRIVAKVAAGNFNPPPKVDSAIIAIENISRDRLAEIPENHFFAVTRAGFASKRKLALNNVAKLWPKEKVSDAFVNAGVSLNERAENISLESWISIAKDLL